MKYGLGLLGYLWMASVCAAAFPPDCKNVRLDNDNPVLMAPKTHIFLIQNISAQTLWITHPTQNPGASAGYTSELGVGGWSALVLKNPKFALGCVESKPGHEQAVSCAEAIRVCAYTKIPKDTQGNYWLIENVTMPKLRDAIQKLQSTTKNKQITGDNTDF